MIIRRRVFAVAVVCAALNAAGCATTSAYALDRAVIAYDRTVADLIGKQLLLNIARSRHNEPIHFTAVSSIAATFNFTVSAGVGPVLTGDVGTLPMPSLGASATENPTITISPMQGDEFTSRLLTPFQEQKLTMLLRQGYDIDSLLRIIGAELHMVDEHGADIRYRNTPKDKEGYTFFRRVMTHLSSIQDLGGLHVEPLHFLLQRTVPASAVGSDEMKALYEEPSLHYDTASQLYHVARRVSGRIIITNYDTATLPEAERIKLNQDAEESPFNEVMIDLRAGHPGGEIPMRARLRMRSFLAVLNFLGRSIEEDPEFDVKPDPRTPVVTENPKAVLAIAESARGRKGGQLEIGFRDLYYSVAADNEYQWNKKAFSLLYQLFQMTVAPAPQNAPLITISK